MKTVNKGVFGFFKHEEAINKADCGTTGKHE